MSDLKEWLTEGLHHCGMCGQQAVEINSRGQWICTACLNEVRPDFMSALRMEAAARIEELEAENKRLIGDAKKFAAKLAIKGGDENYPTLWAYEQACASLDKHRARAEAAEAKLAESEVDKLHDILLAIEMMTATGSGLSPEATIDIHILAAEGRSDDPCAWRADPAVIARLRAAIREGKDG